MGAVSRIRSGFLIWAAQVGVPCVMLMLVQKMYINLEKMD